MNKQKTNWHFCYWDEPEFNYKPVKKTKHGTESNTSRKEVIVETKKTKRV
tara:strand:+ start:5331 stop:5480 length:150 start_codon:yes stop_codon:yes gene_type:complete